jgi:hypothetical protein
MTCARGPLYRGSGLGGSVILLPVIEPPSCALKTPNHSAKKSHTKISPPRVPHVTATFDVLKHYVVCSHNQRYRKARRAGLLGLFMLERLLNVIYWTMSGAGIALMIVGVLMFVGVLWGMIVPDMGGPSLFLFIPGALLWGLGRSLAE